MKFEVVSFKKLLGMRFNIPSYQRGYRWEKENVEALLDDIYQFAINETKDKNEFYCLQPVVVKRNEYLSNKEGVDVYDLIDGQQRLTTLWLILNSSRFKNFWENEYSNQKQLYSMEYESRDNLFDNALNDNLDPYNNIDLFYLKKALSTINNWEGDRLDVLRALVPKSDNKQNDVRIIWYEFDSVSEENNIANSQSSSIKVFSRLNYGKIGLTDTELIKALILQSDIYPHDTSRHNNAVMKEHLFRISTEWDDIEKNMHSEQLWGMIAPIEYNPANHIELLLQFVANQIQAKEKYDIFDNNRRDFHIIYKFLGLNGSVDPDIYAEKVDDLWKRITDAYNAINNWYINDEYYHLVGLLVMLKSNSNPIVLIKEIFENYSYECKDKSSFKRYLEEEIGKSIRITEKIDDSENEKQRTLKLAELKYKVHNSRLIKILEATNIYLHLKCNYIENRFNFSKFKHFNVTSLEHIHPQHLNFEDDVTYDDVIQWYETIKTIVSSNAAFENDENLTKVMRELKSILGSKETFNSDINRCQSLTETVDEFFDEKAGMTDGHMHTLYNMALVDKDTNAALSNNLIDKKRRILQQRAADSLTYVPVATDFVFNKHFSNEVSDMKFWNEKDRNEYFSKIDEAYNYFTSKINK